MRRAHRRLPAVLVAVLLAACTSVPALSPPAHPVPDLVGTWTGTWGGTPLRLVVLEQADRQTSAVTVGPWPLGGDVMPVVSGVLTFVARGDAVSVNARGRLGDAGGQLALVLEPLTPSGEQIVLTRVDAARMTGEGTSPLAWEPQGPIELVREAR